MQEPWSGTAEQIHQEPSWQPQPVFLALGLLNNHHPQGALPQNLQIAELFLVSFPHILAKPCLTFKGFYKARVEIKQPKDFDGGIRGCTQREYLPI